MEDQKNKRRKFDREFKISAVKMITQEGHKASEVARSLDINVNRLCEWKKKYSEKGDKAFSGKGNLTEMILLRRQVKELRMEQEILKKALGIFSRTTESDLNL